MLLLLIFTVALVVLVLMLLQIHFLILPYLQAFQQFVMEDLFRWMQGQVLLVIYGTMEVANSH